MHNENINYSQIILINMAATRACHQQKGIGDKNSHFYLVIRSMSLNIQ